MTGPKEREAGILKRFVAVYCEGRHSCGGRRPGTPHDPAKHPAGTSGTLCPDCAALLDYSLERLERCPFDPKPKCKDCAVHCYKPEMRGRIKAVMRYAGIRAVLRGRFDWLLKYFWN